MLSTCKSPIKYIASFIQNQAESDEEAAGAADVGEEAGEAGVSAAAVAFASVTFAAEAAAAVEAGFCASAEVAWVSWVLTVSLADAEVPMADAPDADADADAATDSDADAEADADALALALIDMAAAFIAAALRSRLYVVGTLNCTSCNHGIVYPFCPTRTVAAAWMSSFSSGMMANAAIAPCVSRTFGMLPELAVPCAGITKLSIAAAKNAYVSLFSPELDCTNSTTSSVSSGFCISKSMLTRFVTRESSVMKTLT